MVMGFPQERDESLAVALDRTSAQRMNPCILIRITCLLIPDGWRCRDEPAAYDVAPTTWVRHQTRRAIEPAAATTTCPRRRKTISRGSTSLSLHRRLLAAAGLASLLLHRWPSPRADRPAIAGHHRRADRQARHAVGRVLRPLRGGRLRSRCGPASRASSTSCISATARSSRPATCCSPSTSGRSRSRSKAREAEVAAHQGAGRHWPSCRSSAARRWSRPGPSPTREYDQRKANLDVATAQLKTAEAGRTQRRAQPRMDRGAGAAGRPHLRPQGRCRQPDLRAARTARRCSPPSSRSIRSASCSTSRRPITCATRVWSCPARWPSARDAVDIRCEIRLADETELDAARGKVDFVDNAVSARSGTIRGARRRREQEPVPDARHLRPRCSSLAAKYDALLIPDTAIVSDQARKIVLTVGTDNGVQAKPVDARVRSATACAWSARASTATDKVVIDGTRQSDGAAGRQGRAAEGPDQVADEAN